MRPAPLSHRTVPSGQIDRCQIEKSAPDFMAFPIVVEHGLAIVGVNALDERLEGPAERAGLQAVLRFQDLGPLRARRWCSPCPRSRRRRSEGEPHPLFSRPQGLFHLPAARPVGQHRQRPDVPPLRCFASGWF